MGVGGATGLAAQGVVVSGRVRYGPAGRPLARTRVVLHQVSMGGDGRPIDSTSTDAQGRYTLTIRRPDSTAMYVVSSWHAGIAYFSEPVVPSRSTSVPLRALYVYDTSSAGPAVRAARLASLGVERIEGRRFARYRTPALGAGAQLAIAFSDRPLAPEALVPFVVGLAALALAVGFVVALRRKPR